MAVFVLFILFAGILIFFSGKYRDKLSESDEESYLREIQFLKSFVQQLDSDYRLGKIDQQSYDDNLYLINARLEHIEERLGR